MGVSVLKKYQEKITENGIAHLMFYADEMTDIIHPFSFNEYEVLSEGFVGFLDKYKSIIPSKVPIVLEIIGNEWTDKEKETIDKTIWAHFGIKMTIARAEVKKFLWRGLLYLVFTILSAVLLFCVNGNDNEVVSNFAYLPFWFFGYRLLTIIILDLVPAFKCESWYKRLASTILIFSKEQIDFSDKVDYEKVQSEFDQYKKETKAAVHHHKLLDEYVMDDGMVSIGCTVHSLSDFVLVPWIEGREFLTDEMASYLDAVTEVVKPNSTIELTVDGVAFSDEEQDLIRKGIKHYFSWSMADKERNQKDNNKLIAIFIVAILVICAMIIGFGKKLDLGMHEFVIMLFWFFADYVLEFILISKHNINNMRKIYEACYHMNVDFIGKDTND